MPAYSWQTDPFGYMGSNSPNFIAAGQPEFARGDLENEKARVAAGGAPTYNPILAGQFGNIPAYDLNKGQSYSDFLSREAARTQAGANSGPYTNNPTLNWNFLNQNSNAIPTSNFRLPTYQDPQGVNYAIRAGTTALPSWATNVTPNWQQLIGGGQAQWGNPGAPSYQPGQNIFAPPPAATASNTSQSASITTPVSPNFANINATAPTQAQINAFRQWNPNFNPSDLNSFASAGPGPSMPSIDTRPPGQLTNGLGVGNWRANLINDLGVGFYGRTDDQEVNPNPIEGIRSVPSGAFGYETAYSTSNEPARAATPVVLPPYNVNARPFPDYTTGFNEPDYIGNLDEFYRTGNPNDAFKIGQPSDLPPEYKSQQEIIQSIQEKAQRRIENARKVGPVSAQDENRIYQEEAILAGRTEAAKNEPNRVIDLSPGSTQGVSANQIPWIIPISGLNPMAAIAATILLNSMGRGGGGSTGGPSSTPSTGTGTSTTTGTTTTTTTGGDNIDPITGAVIGTGTSTGTQPPAGETPEQRAAREERERQARALIFSTMGTPQTNTNTPSEGNESCPNGWIRNAQGVCAPVPFTGVLPVNPRTEDPNTGACPIDGMVRNSQGVCVWPDNPQQPPFRGVVPTNTRTDTGTTSTSTVITGTTSTTTTTGTTSTSTNTGTVYNPVTRDTTASLRNLLGEGTTTAAALQQILPSIYQLYGQGARSLAQSDLERMAGITGGNIFGAQNANLTQLAAQQTAAANRALREGNLADAQALAMQAESLKRQANPELYDALQQQQQVATGQVTTDLQRLQAAQARQLSPEDVRNAQQAAREAYSARGLVMGPGAIGAEILNRENLARQREQEARANLQTSMQNLGQTIGYRTANVFDPLGATLGQQYGMQTGNQGLNQALFNQAAGISGGAYGYGYAQNLANPFSPYAQDVYGTNVNALNAAAIANANRAAALEAAKLGQTGTYAQALGSFLGSSTGQSTVDALLKALGIK